jgi:hypothetical protein
VGTPAPKPQRSGSSRTGRPALRCACAEFLCSAAGVFNVEGDCYAKVVRLPREVEPQI